MCGIAGFCDFNGRSNEVMLENMTNVLMHRGPDGAGYDMLLTPQAQIGLGHRRLSIIDLSDQGKQPMQVGDWTIVFNGEIYNYQAIAQELRAKGYQFSSSSDTEVLVNAFDCWGTQAVDKLIGMFAFVLFHHKTQQLYVFRDRAGVKPLYYYWHEGLFLFASELKAFHQHPHFRKQLHTNSLHQYFKYGYVAAPQTIFEHCYKLEQGHFLQVDIPKQIVQKHQYWSVTNGYKKPLLTLTRPEIVTEIERLLLNACQYRMVADVPVGVFLSGGIDSSVVTALLQTNQTEKLKTFTIGFQEDDFNEAPFAQQIAQYLGTDHTTHYCTTQEALSIIPALGDIYDEPFGDSSAIPTILVSRFARQSVTVALSADGGDEAFAGYDRYKAILSYLPKVKKIPLPIRQWLYPILTHINPAWLSSSTQFQGRFDKAKNIWLANTPSEALRQVSTYFNDTELRKLLTMPTVEETSYWQQDFIDTNDTLNQVLATDYQTYMADDILTKVDRATMSVGLEGREPLLDHRLIEFLAQVAGTEKINPTPKSILKEIAYKHIPQTLLDRPKKGFGVPIKTWFEQDLQEHLMTLTDEKLLTEQGILNAKEVIRYRDKYLKGEVHNHSKIWYLFAFQLWYKRWM